MLISSKLLEHFDCVLQNLEWKLLHLILWLVFYINYLLFSFERDHNMCAQTSGRLFAQTAVEYSKSLQDFCTLILSWTFWVEHTFLWFMMTCFADQHCWFSGLSVPICFCLNALPNVLLIKFYSIVSLYC